MPKLDIDQNEVAKQSEGMGLYPEGNYTLLIDSSETKVSQKSGDELVFLNCKILDSDTGRDLEGKEIGIMLNVYSSNQTAREIAYGTVGKIQEALDKVGEMDTDEWIDIPFKVTVKHRAGYHNFSNFQAAEEVPVVADAAANATRRANTATAGRRGRAR